MHCMHVLMHSLLTFPGFILLRRTLLCRLRFLACRGHSTILWTSTLNPSEAMWLTL
jgi:hypothetical protein